MAPLKLYGVELSQPVRAVRFALAMHGVEHDFIQVMPGSNKKGGSKSPEFLEMNPMGTVPVLDDNGVVIWESHAILIYLSEKLGWEDVYPKDPKSRGHILQWLSWHHANLRQITLGHFAPHFRPDLTKDEGLIKRAQSTGDYALGKVEAQLSKTKFFTGATPTLADISAYEEIGQMKQMSLKDLTQYPSITRWLTDVEGLPGWTESHAGPMALGRKLLEKMKPKAKL
mmetsp:Transcript_58734/g.137058  ORF Transcript_58734/g.137058 Transcript_58734/m.137058 type:complete len:227 (-) Transcript_58734:193-873(-)